MEAWPVPSKPASPGWSLTSRSEHPDTRPDGWGRDKRRVPPWVRTIRMVVNGELACGGPCEAWHAAVLRMMLRMRIRHVGSEWEW